VQSACSRRRARWMSPGGHMHVGSPLSVGQSGRLSDHSNPAFDSPRRRHVPQRRKEWRRCTVHCGLLLISRNGVVSSHGRLTSKPNLSKKVKRSVDNYLTKTVYKSLTSLMLARPGTSTAVAGATNRLLGGSKARFGSCADRPVSRW